MDAKLLQQLECEGKVESLIRLLIRCGEFCKAAETACVYLEAAWSLSAHQWSCAVLAAVDRAVHVPDSDTCLSAFWSLNLHPSALLIVGVSSLLQFLPLASLPVHFKQRALLLSALSALFNAMSHGFCRIVTPLCRLIVSLDGVGGAWLPVPSKLLRLIQGVFEFRVAGDASAALQALQRYCVAQPAQSLQHLGAFADGQEAVGSPSATNISEAFMHANAAACTAAAPIISALQRKFAHRTASVGEHKPGEMVFLQCGLHPVSSKLPGACTLVGIDTGFQEKHHGGGAGGRFSTESGQRTQFASAVSGRAVRRGMVTLDGTFCASEQEAVEWACVMPFSPTGTGEWIVPF
jgi:hypothetical protein